MRYLYYVAVPGTEGLRYEGDRIEPWATAGGPISKAEKLDASSDAKVPPLVLLIRGLYNSTLPPEAPAEAAAWIEVHPLYDNTDAIIDTLSYMDDPDLLVVPAAAVNNAPGVTQQMRDAYFARLALIAVKEATTAAAAGLNAALAKIPPEAKAQVPQTVSISIPGSGG